MALGMTMKWPGWDSNRQSLAARLEGCSFHLRQQPQPQPQQQQQQQRQQPQQQQHHQSQSPNMKFQLHMRFWSSSMALINAVKAPEHWGDLPRSLPTKCCHFQHRQGLTTETTSGLGCLQKSIAVYMQHSKSKPLLLICNIQRVNHSKAGIEDWHTKLSKNIYFWLLLMKHINVVDKTCRHGGQKRQASKLQRNKQTNLPCLDRQTKTQNWASKSCAYQ